MNYIPSVQKFCMGFSVRVKLFPPVQTLGSVECKLKIFETTLVSRGSRVNYRIFNNFSPHIMETIPDKLCKSSNGTRGISVSLDSELINELQYPDSKEYFLTLKSISLIKTILKHVPAFVWSGLKHCR